MSEQRNDGYLYSGMSSKVDRKVAEQRKEQKEAAERTVERVAPSLEPVLAEVQKMKDSVTNVKNVLFNDGLTEDQKLKLMERMKLDYELLTEVERRIKTVFKARREPSND